MFGFGIGKMLMGGMVLVIVVMGLAFKLYFTSSQNTIASLHTDLATSQAAVATLEQATIEQNESILRLEDQRKVDQARMLKLAEEKTKFSQELEKLRSKLDHDFYALTLSKPQWMEKLINKGSKKVLRDLENITKPEPEASND